MVNTHIAGNQHILYILHDQYQLYADAEKGGQTAVKTTFRKKLTTDEAFRIMNMEQQSITKEALETV